MLRLGPEFECAQRVALLRIDWCVEKKNPLPRTHLKPPCFVYPYEQHGSRTPLAGRPGCELPKMVRIENFICVSLRITFFRVRK